MASPKLADRERRRSTWRRRAGVVLSTVGLLSMSLAILGPPARAATLPGGSVNIDAVLGAENGATFNETCGGNGATDHIHANNDKPDDAEAFGTTQLQSAPDNDDLCTTRVASEAVNDTTYLYVGWTAYHCVGLGSVSFQLAQSTGTYAAGNGDAFSTMTVGDFWAEVEWKADNTISVNLYEWDGANWDEITPVPAGAIVAAFNAGTCTGEVGIDLGLIGIFEAGVCEAFASETTHTQSSHSFNSSLQDFQGPNPIDVSNCEIHLEKTADPTAAAAGQTVAYTFVVTNPGNTALVDVAVTDPDCDSAVALVTKNGDASPNSLDAGDEWEFTCDREIEAADPDPVPNTATVVGYDAADNPISDTDDASVDKLIPHIDVQKDVTGGSPYDAAGDVISYDIVVTNDGEVPLTSIDVTDPGADALPACPGGNPIPGPLSPGDDVTCTATHTVTQDDLEAGSYENTATAVAAEGVDDDDDAVAAGIQSPAVDLTKEESPVETYDEVGDVVDYELEVTNAGNLILTGIVVTDPGADSVSCPGDILDPGESMTCTAIHVVTQADLDEGSYHNVARVDTDQEVFDEDDETVDMVQDPSLEVTKDVTSEGPYDFGSTVNYAISVENTGNVTLHNVTLDDLVEAVEVTNCDPTQPATLAPGETLTCDASYVITQADVDAGEFENTAVGDSDETPPDTDSETVPVVQDPELRIDKDVVNVPEGGYAVGDPIAFEIVATNTGNMTLHNVTIDELVDDATLGDCEPDIPTTLAPGASVTCEAVHIVDQGDLDAGEYTNIAEADADEVDPVDDDVTVDLPQQPLLTTDKTVTSDGPYDLGDVITFDIEVTNAGNITLTGVTITEAVDDATLGDCVPGQPATLAPGESMVCEASHVVDEDDFVAGEYTNVAIGDSDQTPPDDDDETVPTPAPLVDLAVDKTQVTATLDFGQQATYQIVATNLGPGIEPEPFIVDQLPTGTSFVSATGDGWTCVAGAGNTVTCEHAAALVPGASLPPLDLVVLIAPDAPVSLTNSVVVSGVREDADLSNNTDSVTGIVTVVLGVVETLPITGGDDRTGQVALGLLAGGFGLALLIRRRGVAEN